MERTAELRALHRVTYENGMAMQDHLVALRQRHEIPDQLLLLEHPPVITLGRSGRSSNLLATPEMLASWGVRFYETTRGGDITYHGPGQIVGYPIVHLGEGRRDIRRYVWKLEEVLIRTVAEYGIVAQRIEGRRGIWVGQSKIAAIGVRVARWVTSHGFALNVDPDLGHFRLITPCGLHGTGVTSIARETGAVPGRGEVEEHLASHFADVFETELVPSGESLRLVKIVVWRETAGGPEILLLRRTPERGDFWQPVTGRIEPGEDAVAAAARELVEETGVRLTPEPLSLRQSFLIDGAFLPTENGPRFVDEISFASRADSRDPIAPASGEHVDIAWLSPAEALDRIRWSDDRETIEHWMRQR